MPKKTSTEYVRAYRARLRANKPPKPPPKSKSQKNREYWARKKALKNAAALALAQTGGDAVVSELTLSQVHTIPTVGPKKSLKDSVSRYKWIPATSLPQTGCNDDDDRDGESSSKASILPTIPQTESLNDSVTGYKWIEATSLAQTGGGGDDDVVGESSSQVSTLSTVVSTESLNDSVPRYTWVTCEDFISASAGVKNTDLQCKTYTVTTEDPVIQVERRIDEEKVIEMAAKIEPPSSASSESDGDICFDDRSVFLADDHDNDVYRHDVVTPTPQSPRPPSTDLLPPGSQKSPRSRRQRTTSLSQSSKKTSAESILRSKNRTIYTAGRPPWYNCAGQQVEPFVIGICGGSASGKTTVATKIIESLDVSWVTLLSMDSFYKVLNEKQHDMAARNEYNFDHPDAFDFELLKTTLQRLKEGRKVEVPIYNFVTHSRENRTKTMYGANVIIFEGILTFYDAAVLKLCDMKVFVDTDADVRLARRLHRDISQRGRDLEGVLKQYCTMVKPSFFYYIAPMMVYADIIVPRGGDNEVAIELIVQHVHTQLQLRGFKLREKLAHSFIGQPQPSSLYLLPNTPQIKGLHTFIRNKHTYRDEFIFYSKRLIRLVIEYALSLLPFEEITVETPQGVPYHGKRSATNKICGVSILRAGETMEQAVCDVCKDIRIGKILIQTNLQTDEPELYYLRLPKDIKDYRVILMDATVATGAAAMMAIRVLLDHDVTEENILLVSLLMAESGVHSIAYAFPQVKIVTTALDPEINERFYVLPGIGNFGDRYFGTEPSTED